MDNDVHSLLAVVASLATVGFVNSIEAALVGVTEVSVRTALAEGVSRARWLAAWLEHPGRMLATLHVVRLSAAVTFALAGWSWVSRALPLVPLPAYVAAAALALLTLGHLGPRTVAKAHAFSWALATIGIVRFLTIVLLPLIGPVAALVHKVAHFAGAPPRLASAFWTPDEIGRIAVEHQTRALGQRGTELLHSIIEFSDTVIREIMVPRTEMVGIEADSSAEEVLRTIVEARHSRLPVYTETMDNIVGVLHVKDLFHTLAPPGSTPQRGFDLRATVRATFYVPEVMKISELLREFQRRRTHMAIVVDEYGGTAGVVTLEDIIEEIVGDIQDEYDVEEKQFRNAGDDKVIADGRASIWELEQALGVEFPDDAEYETLAGFLVSRVGYLPRAGAVIQWDGLRFTVKEADEKRIDTVEIERRREAAAG